MPTDLSAVAQHSRLEENFSALMHGDNSDGRVCVFLRSAQHVILP